MNRRRPELHQAFVAFCLIRCTGSLSSGLPTSTSLPPKATSPVLTWPNSPGDFAGPVAVGGIRQERR